MILQTTVIMLYPGQINPTIGADIISVSCAGPLSGVYTIGSGEDYETISDAITALISCGMSGTVNFKIAAGTYNEQFILNPDYTGKTLNDSVIFSSVSGNAEDVIITYGASKEDNYIIKINGLDNFVLRGVTLEAVNSNYGRLVEISGNSNNCLFENNIFTGIVTTENNDSLALVYYVNESVDSVQVFHNNSFINGSYAIYKEDGSVRSGNMQISENDFSDQGYGAVYLYNIEGFTFVSNKVNTTTESYYCIQNLSGDSVYLAKNNVNIETNSGYFINSSAIATALENNFISFTSSSNSYIYLVYLRQNMYLYYNTLVIRGTNENSNIVNMSSNSCLQLIQKNNIMANLSGGKVFDVYYNIPTVVSDHNDLFTTNSGSYRFSVKNGVFVSGSTYLSH